jgi:23S rRNA (cytidine1920-2'-O)/16S rRNA (cytidine1409-2'-O)-methyltransferase
MKLAHALNHFKIEPYQKICLDIGASTGGFTELLLLRGAHKVYAVDVGHGQLDPKLARDPRVVSLEKTNARELTDKIIPEKPQAIVADVSFISLKLALPPALAMAEKGAWLVALVKPQFEVGKANVGKGGIVKDEAAQNAALADIERWLVEDQGWNLLGSMESPLKGGDGNREFLVVARKP